MHSFEDILHALAGHNHVQIVKPEPENDFKVFVIDYIQNHDELENGHPVIGQIQNLNSVSEIEQILRSNLDYCDDCVIKMYRRFAAGGQEEPENLCGCGGE